MLKFFRYLMLGIIVLFLFILTVIYLFLRSSLPDYEGKIISESINAPVTVYFDRMGIPQIEATSDHDLFYVLGWLHAQERLFQMELTRRVACGTLAAALGKDLLAIDRLQRTIGHRRIALTELPHLEEQTKSRLAAYTSGINAWVSYSAALPFEFYLLGIEFEAWTPLDCLTIYSFQTWYADYLQNNDALYISVEEQFGTTKATELQVQYPYWAPATAYNNPYINIDNTVFTKANGWASASNSWVIAPRRSESGFAMLASDPHLDIYLLPQFWYAVGLHCSESDLHAFGVTAAGLPYMAYGHNEQASWAFTAAGVDVTDFYLEKLHPQDKSLYKTPEDWAHFDEIHEFIEIKGKDTLEELVIKQTRHGPVVEQDDSLKFAKAFRWAGFDVPLAEAMKNGFDMLKVAEFDSFRALITGFGALNASWTYADKSGTIGYQLGTPVPVRDFTNSQVLLPGWEKRYDWKGYHELERTPHVSNPEKGWLANCNNKPSADNLGYDVPGNFAVDRILRISELLESEEKYSRDDMRKFQYDHISKYILRWKESAENILIQLNMRPLANELDSWSGDYSGKGQMGALMNLWIYYLKKLTFEDELSSETGEFENPNIFRDIVLEKIYFEGPDEWFDDIRTRDTVESKGDISRRAMQLAIEEADGKSWFDLHKLEIKHPFSQNALINFVLNLSRGPFPMGGAGSTLNAMTSVKDPLGGFNVRVGPSMRMVVDFADINNTTIVFPAGQSGHPLSTHFFDFYDLWSSGETWIMPFDRTVIAQQSESRLLFVPVTD